MRVNEVKRLKKWVQSVDEGLIIAPSAMHPSVLKQLSGEPLKNVQVMDPYAWQLFHGHTIDAPAAAFLSDRFKLPPSVVQEIIQALTLVLTPVYEGPLKDYYAALKDANLVHKDAYKTRPMARHILWVNAPLDPYSKALLDAVYAEVSIQTLKLEESKEPVPYYLFDGAYEEVESLAKWLAHQLVEGSDINAFKVHTSEAEYHRLIQLIFPRFNLPFQRLSDQTLAQTPLYHSLKAAVLEARDIHTVESSIKKIMRLEIQKTPELAYLIQPVSRALLDVKDASPDVFKTLLLDRIKALKLKRLTQVDTVDVGSFVGHDLSAASLIILGASEGDFPKTMKHPNYLSDEALKTLGLNRPMDTMKQRTFEALTLLYHPSVKWVSHAKRLLTAEKIPSLLIEDALTAGRLKQTVFIEPAVHTSIRQDRLAVAKALDDFRLYQKEHPLLKAYKATPELMNHPPRPFTHKKSTLRKDLTQRLIEHRTRLSYSRLEDYFKCEFRFLLKHLLNVEETFADTLPALIGNVYHEALALIDTLPDDLTGRYDVYFTVIEDVIEAEKKPVSMEERFYLYNVLDGLDAFMTHVKEFHATTHYTPFAYEKKIQVALNGTHVKDMIGIVDKIMADGTQYAIIDYKSSQRDTHLSPYEFALGSQLPFYMSLVQEHVEGLNTPTGFFYHPFTLNIEKAKPGHTHADLQKSQWALDGHIDAARVDRFDPNFDHASMIKGMGTIQGGAFRKSAKTLTTGELNALTSLIKRRVDEAIQGIESGAFTINPKGTFDQTPSCQYCEFKDICYKKPSDFVAFKTDSDKAFIETLMGGGF